MPDPLTVISFLIRGVLFIASVAFMSTSVAQVAWTVPPNPASIIDQTNTLDSDQLSHLQSKVSDIHQKYTVPVIVLLIPSTSPEEIGPFSQRIAQSLLDEGRGKGRGVLLVVAKDDRKMRLSVSADLASTIPDSVAAGIIDQTLKPKFREGRFSEGLNSAIDELTPLLSAAHENTQNQAALIAQRAKMEQEKFRLEQERMKAEKERLSLEQARIKADKDKIQAEREQSALISRLIRWAIYLLLAVVVFVVVFLLGQHFKKLAIRNRNRILDRDPATEQSLDKNHAGFISKKSIALYAAIIMLTLLTLAIKMAQSSSSLNKPEPAARVETIADRFEAMAVRIESKGGNCIIIAQQLRKAVQFYGPASERAGKMISYAEANGCFEGNFRR